MARTLVLPSMPNDGAIAERFAQLLATHGPGLRRVARAYAPGPDDAADLTQDIAVAIWRALPSFRAESSERTFVYRIAHNRGISHREARRTREPAPSAVDLTTIADAGPTADVAMDAARRQRALWAAIAALPLGARSVLLLALEGLSHDEIADVLGTTSNSVAVRLSRARALLRTHLESIK